MKLEKIKMLNASTLLYLCIVATLQKTGTLTALWKEYESNWKESDIDINHITFLLFADSVDERHETERTAIATGREAARIEWLVLALLGKWSALEENSLGGKNTNAVCILEAALRGFCRGRYPLAHLIGRLESAVEKSDYDAVPDATLPRNYEKLLAQLYGYASAYVETEKGKEKSIPSSFDLDAVWPLVKELLYAHWGGVAYLEQFVDYHPGLEAEALSSVELAAKGQES